jgi:hypothetical protein
MSDWHVTATGLTIVIADALWAARGMWANLLILLLVWRLTLQTREVALYFRARRLLSEQRRLLRVASSLEDQFGSNVSDDDKEHADLEKSLGKVQHRLRKLDRILGWSSLERSSPS